MDVLLFDGLTCTVNTTIPFISFSLFWHSPLLNIVEYKLECDIRQYMFLTLLRLIFRRLRKCVLGYT